MPDRAWGGGAEGDLGGEGEGGAPGVAPASGVEEGDDPAGRSVKMGMKRFR